MVVVINYLINNTEPYLEKIAASVFRWYLSR